jgi:hypothetical protein
MSSPELCEAAPFFDEDEAEGEAERFRLQPSMEVRANLVGGTGGMVEYGWWGWGDGELGEQDGECLYPLEEGQW